MKTYLVPFIAEEICWNNCIAKVEAKSKEEAFKKVEKSIEESNPFRDFDAEWNGINTVTDECIQTIAYKIGEDFGISIEDVKEIESPIKCELSLTAFDIARYGKDELYNMVEAEFLEVGLVLEIFEMKMIPNSIEEHFVKYDCVPTEYKQFFTDETYVYMKDGIRIGGNFNK